MSKSAFRDTIVSADPTVRDRPFELLCKGMPVEQLLHACDDLEILRRESSSLYERVRASLFLYAIYRFQLAGSDAFPLSGAIPHEAFSDLLERRFEEALHRLRKELMDHGPHGTLLSALAQTYHQLAFQTLADQVRRSVRASRGNRWMFRIGHPDDHPLRLRGELLRRPNGAPLYPILTEHTPVRLDLSHSGWSDIFFLGMDYPEGARVLNISVDLGVYGRDAGTRPPIDTCVRVIPEPVLRLTSVDLGATKDITDLQELFRFGNDYLGLLKAGVIASGLIPPSFEGTAHDLKAILQTLVAPGMGLEVVTRVNDIPKGSRLAVSTNLLAGIISVLMRATGQTRQILGGLDESERRLVASRAILGEWLGGSGGGWQDSGGVWPGFKVIEGALAGEGDPESGISKGCLLPRHKVLGEEELHPEIRERLAASLVLVHGGMAQNVGPILEMVTEKYLLRSHREWEARQSVRGIFDGIVRSLRAGDVRSLGACTMRNWEGPLKTIIPWVTNPFTERLIADARRQFPDDFWGFLMLGGMSGGGMGLFVHPDRRDAFRDEVLRIMAHAKSELEDAVPFAMDPLVYNFSVNDRGTWAEIAEGEEALMSSSYYALHIPSLVTRDAGTIPYLRRAELDHFTARQLDPGSSRDLLRSVVGNLFKVTDAVSGDGQAAWDRESVRIKAENGFDPVHHEQLKADLRQGRIGLVCNRLPVETQIEDVSPEDVVQLTGERGPAYRAGQKALAEGSVAVLSLAGGVGSRWTHGAGVIKAVTPFVMMQGCHRSFLEIHLAKTSKTSNACGCPVPHLISTSYLSHEPVRRHLERTGNHGYDGPVFLSPGRSIGQRFIPMVRDLVFLWEETPQETLDEQKQKVRESVRGALIEWARASGEGNDYTSNVPLQRFNPPGHWYEVPNLLRNGTLAALLRERPGLQTLMLHNIDTLGADLDPEALGHHLASGNTLTFEVVPRHIIDRGGGLARVNGRVRLLEGLAQPREEDELRLRYYNSLTTWIQIDPLLDLFGLARSDLYGPQEPITRAVRRVAHRLPTYVTIKDVKRRWGHAQEDVYPVAQTEKLWGDMTSLVDCPCGFLAVPRMRGQQLKDLDELDPWANDGSKAHVESLCLFDGPHEKENDA